MEQFLKSIFLTGLCKHVLAFAAWIYHESIKPSVTDEVCYWRKSSLSCVDLNMKPSDMTPDGKAAAIPKSKYLENAGSFLEKVKGRLTAARMPSMLLSQIENTTHPMDMQGLSHRFFTADGVVKDFASFKCFVSRRLEGLTPKLLKETKLETLKQSNSALWKLLRFCRITSSILSSAAVNKEDRTQEAIDGVVSKLFGTGKMNPRKATAEAMKRGLDIEADVRRQFSKDKKRRVEPGHFLMTPDLPLCGASPDGVGTDFLLEIKSPISNANIKNFVKVDGTPTKKVLLQILLQLKMSGKSLCYLIITDDDFEKNHKYKTVEVHLNQENDAVLTTALEHAEMFWKQHIFPKLAKVMRPVMKM